MTDTNSLIRSIRDLAAVRHPEAQQVSVNLTVDYSLARDVGIELPDGVPLSTAATPVPAPWAAQVRLGGGKWGHVVTPAKTPLEALQGLHDHYVGCHRLVDGVRSRVLANAESLAVDTSKACESGTFEQAPNAHAPRGTIRAVPLDLTDLQRLADYERTKRDHDAGVKAALRAMFHTSGGGQAWEAVKRLLPTEEAEAMQKEAEAAPARPQYASGTFDGAKALDGLRKMTEAAKP